MEKGEWCIKETATAALTKKTQNMSSKSRYKPRLKGAVASIKGTSQQLWSKSVRYLDEELYHCTWNSKMTDDKQSNTESEGFSEYGNTLSAIILSIGKERMTLMEIYMMISLAPNLHNSTRQQECPTKSHGC